MSVRTDNKNTLIIKSEYQIKDVIKYASRPMGTEDFEGVLVREPIIEKKENKLVKKEDQ